MAQLFEVHPENPQARLLKQAVAMAYVPSALAALGTLVDVELRGEPRKAQVVAYPFVQTGLTAN